MPMFSYTVKDNAGKTKTGIVESLNDQALVDKLQSEGYFIIDVRLAMGQSVPRIEKKETEFRFDHQEVRLEDLLVFSRQMATMIEAGVNVLRSLDIVIPQIQSKRLFMAIKQIYEDLKRGSSFSAALMKHPKIFDQFWVSLAEVGEASGTMPKVLNRLADHVEKDAAFRSIIISALVYPAVLGVASVGAITFFALVVAPRFETIFTAMHSQLPFMTRFLLGIFDFIKHYILFIVGGITVAIVSLKIYIATPFGRLRYEKILFGLPLVGGVIKLIIVERFSSQMAILVESGVPLLYSLEISEKLVDNKICGIVIAQVRERVREGRNLADAMMEAGFFPVMSVQMIKVGEETGELSKMLQHVADFYERNVEATMKRFGTLIEPFMLIFMAGTIGTIVVSIFLPLFKLGQGAGYAH